MYKAKPIAEAYLREKNSALCRRDELRRAAVNLADGPYR
jgi:hypothetical protein